MVTPSVANLQIPITSSQCNVALIAFYAFNASNILSNTNTIVLHWLFSRKTEATWLYCDFWSCQAAQVWQWQGKATEWQGQYVLRASLTKQNNLRLSTVSLFGSLADLVWSQNITGICAKYEEFLVMFGKAAAYCWDGMQHQIGSGLSRSCTTFMIQQLDQEKFQSLVALNILDQIQHCPISRK